MVISPNSYEHHSTLRQGTLISNPHIVKSFDLKDIKNDIVTIDGLATHYPNIIYNKETGLFNGTYRNNKVRINFWDDLKIKHPDLYQSQLADLEDSKPPSSKNREEYKKFLKDHMLLINTMEVFEKEWRPLFKSVIGIPDDHKDYRVLREWVAIIRSSLNFIKDFLDDGGTIKMNEESLIMYHQNFINSINYMKSAGSLNDMQMIINHELKDAKLDNLIFPNAKAYVENLKFDTLKISNVGLTNTYKDVKGCICIQNCELDTIDMDARCDLFSVEDSKINVIPKINVSNVVYLNNVESSESVDLGITSAEVLIYNNTNISDEMYNELGTMVNAFDTSQNRNLILNSFDDVKTKVNYPDYHVHSDDLSKPSQHIKGTFNGLFKAYWLDNSSITRLLRILNMDAIESFVIFTDDSKMMDFIFKRVEGKKYGDMSAKMFFLLKKLLNK